MDAYHSPKCNCTSCNDKEISKAEKDLHIHLSESSRREFLKTAGRLGLGLGIGGGLLTTPLAAAALNDAHAGYKAAGMQQNRAVQKGKATMLTLLHTADIHSQLLAHDEFFVEQGKAVYKKRGGLASLKTMINTLRNQNTDHTLIIDGGDCFQDDSTTALSQDQAIVPLMNNIKYDIMLPDN